MEKKAALNILVAVVAAVQEVVRVAQEGPVEAQIIPVVAQGYQPDKFLHNKQGHMAQSPEILDIILVPMLQILEEAAAMAAAMEAAEEAVEGIVVSTIMVALVALVLLA